MKLWKKNFSQDFESNEEQCTGHEEYTDYFYTHAHVHMFAVCMNISINVPVLTKVNEISIKLYRSFNEAFYSLSNLQYHELSPLVPVTF